VKDLDLIWDLSLKDLGFETKKMGFEIWLSDLNPFLERFEISVKENKEKQISVFIPVCPSVCPMAQLLGL